MRVLLNNSFTVKLNPSRELSMQEIHKLRLFHRLKICYYFNLRKPTSKIEK